MTHRCLENGNMHLKHPGHLDSMDSEDSCSEKTHGTLADLAESEHQIPVHFEDF